MPAASDNRRSDSGRYLQVKFIKISIQLRMWNSSRFSVFRFLINEPMRLINSLNPGVPTSRLSVRNFRCFKTRRGIRGARIPLRTSLTSSKYQLPRFTVSSRASHMLKIQLPLLRKAHRNSTALLPTGAPKFGISRYSQTRGMYQGSSHQPAEAA